MVVSPYIIVTLVLVFIVTISGLIKNVKSRLENGTDQKLREIHSMMADNQHMVSNADYLMNNLRKEMLKGYQTGNTALVQRAQGHIEKLEESRRHIAVNGVDDPSNVKYTGIWNPYFDGKKMGLSHQVYHGNYNTCTGASHTCGDDNLNNNLEAIIRGPGPVMSPHKIKF